MRLEESRREGLDEMILIPFKKEISGKFKIEVSISLTRIGSDTPVASLRWDLLNDGAIIESGDVFYEGKDWSYFAESFKSFTWLFEEIKEKFGLDISMSDVSEKDICYPNGGKK